MGVHKDFDAAVSEADKVKPTFTLAGETFTCRAKLPWQALTKLMRGMDDEGAALIGVAEFFQTVLVRDDRQRFADLIADEDPDDEDAVVSVDQIQELMGWLMGHYSGKALGLSPDSSDGQPGTGPPSKPRVINLGAASRAS